MKAILAATVLMAVGLVGVCAADTVQLHNGEVLRGSVLSLDAKQVRIHSESLGDLAVDRGKIDAIYFGNRTASPTVAPSTSSTPQAAAPTPKSPEEILKMLGQGPSGGTPEGAIEELQKKGLNPGTMSELQKQFPLLLTPEVQNYFNDTLGGLASGKLDLQDLRKQAVHARDEIDKLQKELGPEASVLNPYRSILDKFIRETTPPEGDKKADKTPSQAPKTK